MLKKRIFISICMIIFSIIIIIGSAKSVELTQQHILILVMIGILYSAITITVMDLTELSKLADDFRPIEGQWEAGISVHGRKLILSSDEIKPTATIKYKTENLLSIILTHKHSPEYPDLTRSWEGIIEMNKSSKSRGSIIFHYTDGFEPGIKELYTYRDSEFEYIILTPYATDNSKSPYQIEVLRRKK